MYISAGHQIFKIHLPNIYLTIVWHYWNDVSTENTFVDSYAETYAHLSNSAVDVVYYTNIGVRNCKLEKLQKRVRNGSW